MTNEVQKVAEELTATYDSSLFLGRLCWYSVDDSVVISRDEFNQRIKDAGIEFAALPPVRPVDVFKRGCTDSQRKKYVPTPQEQTDLMLPAGCVLNHMFRRVGSEKNQVWRVLVRETVDSHGKELGYEEIAKLVFDLKNANFSTRWVTNQVLPVEKEIIHDVSEYYSEWATRATTYSIREFIRKNLEWHLHSVKVRPSGGVYFVQEQYSDTLIALEGVVNDIGAAFHTLPLLDNAKQREMLRAAFEEESIADIAEMMDEMTNLLKGDKSVTSDTYVEYHERYNKLRTKVLEYSDILDSALEKTASYLELAKAQIVKLADKVEV